MSSSRLTLARLAPFGVSFAITSLFFINFCSLIFQCGCRSLWAGADQMCNVHAANSRHCPWCSLGIAGYVVIMTLLCVPQLAVSVLPRWHWTTRTMIAVVAFPIVGVIVALGFGWYDNYWR